MRRPDRWRMPAALAIGAMVLFFGGSAAARDAGSATQPKSPPVAERDEPEAEPSDPEALPPGHPSLGGSTPHAHAAGAEAMPGTFQPPEDTESEDLSLGVGEHHLDRPAMAGSDGLLGAGIGQGPRRRDRLAG